MSMKHINGYGMFNTVSSAEVGRRIIIYVKSDINATKRNLFDFHLIEAAGIKIILRHSDWLFLIAVYCSPYCHVDCLGELGKI